MIFIIMTQEEKCELLKRKFEQFDGTRRRFQQLDNALLGIERGVWREKKKERGSRVREGNLWE